MYKRQIQSLGTDVDASHDRVAAEKAVRVFQVVRALPRSLIAAVGQKAESLQQAGRTDELVGIPPKTGAGGGAAGAQDALCLLYTSPSPRDRTRHRMPSSACQKKVRNLLCASDLPRPATSTAISRISTILCFF